MLEGWLINHQGTALCFNNTDMRLRRRDVEVVSQCSDMEFILTGEYGEDTIEGVELFKYLGRPLKQSDNDWSEVRQNIRKVHQVWGIVGVILRR